MSLPSSFPEILNMDTSDLYEIINCLSSSDNVILYGAGSLGKIMLPYLQNKYHVLCFAVSNAPTEEKIGTILVKKIDDLIKYTDNSVVLITVSPQYQGEIIERLSSLKFKTIIPLTEALRDHLVEEYSIDMFKKHGITLDKDIIKIGNMTVINPLLSMEKNIRNMFIQIGDFIFPSVFNDYSMITEGPYEYENVKITQGQTVIDCGANWGVFSSYAATKGCKVYAFEPTPSLHHIINRHSELNGNNIVLCDSAVSDVDGECDLRICDFTVGGNSIVLDNGFSQTLRVRTKTIDSLVEEKNIHIDFIKADIEGAERLMLLGAKNTLKKQAPMLSLCTYHFPDDKQVLRDIILDINPDYNIIQKWQKLYAWI